MGNSKPGVSKCPSGSALTAAILILTLIWLGLLLGVSFVATPVKFMAPSLSLPVALDVGRQTFAVLNLVELVFVTVLLLFSFANRQYLLISLALAMAALVVAQWLWLLPVLDSRVEIILQGGTPPPSILHLVYITVEGIKLLLLIALSMLAGVKQGAFTGRPSSI